MDYKKKYLKYKLKYLTAKKLFKGGNQEKRTCKKFYERYNKTNDDSKCEDANKLNIWKNHINAYNKILLSYDPDPKCDFKCREDKAKNWQDKEFNKVEFKNLLSTNHSSVDAMAAQRRRQQQQQEEEARQWQQQEEKEKEVAAQMKACRMYYEDEQAPQCVYENIEKWIDLLKLANGKHMEDYNNILNETFDYCACENGTFDNCDCGRGEKYADLWRKEDFSNFTDLQKQRFEELKKEAKNLKLIKEYDS